MAIIHQKDKRSGITYVYESVSYWDKEKKQSRSKRKLIGRLNEETGEVLPTDGRCRKRSPGYVPGEEPCPVPRTLAEYRKAYENLQAENKKLREELSRLKKRLGLTDNEI